MLVLVANASPRAALGFLPRASCVPPAACPCPAGAPFWERSARMRRQRNGRTPTRLEAFELLCQESDLGLRCPEHACPNMTSEGCNTG
jgi:hypothetical protein